MAEAAHRQSIVRRVYELARSKSLVEMMRYATNCGFVLATKLLLTWLFVFWLNPSLAYLVVHVIIFFVSYTLHSKVTFKTKVSWSSLRAYFGAVIGFKCLDYLIFSVLLAALNMTAGFCVLAASICVMFVRFVVVRKVLKRTPSRLRQTG